MEPHWTAGDPQHSDSPGSDSIVAAFHDERNPDSMSAYLRVQATEMASAPYPELLSILANESDAGTGGTKKHLLSITREAILRE